MVNRHDFDSSEELAQTLAKNIAAKLSNAIVERGSASLAVSGGSTPKMLFAALSQVEIDWSNVFITLVDERWVPDTDERSNAKLVKQNLLREWARLARFVPLYVEDMLAQQSLGEIEDNLSEMPQPFDVVVLGMGTDGHTASFFPGGSRLSEALDPDTGFKVIDMEAEGAGEPRITLTLPVIASSKALFLHIEGKEKSDVLARAMNQDGKSGLPIETVMNHCPQMEIYWTA